MTFRILHHNNCFDGACSAAVFTKLHRERLGGSPGGYEYVGLQHGPVSGVPDTAFGPGENAIVDFKFSDSPKLTWWFDHHQSAFASPAQRLAFQAAGDHNGHMFFDAAYISCTGLIADIGKSRFNFDTSRLDDPLKWANIIDGARFESAQAAVEMKEPAMKIALVIENTNDPTFIPRIIPQLTEMTFAELLAQPFVAQNVAPFWQRHLQTMELIRTRADLRDGVVYFDLTDGEVEGLNKFVPYYFHPTATYTVAITRSKVRTKISIGTNPWTSVPFDKLVNLGTVCERFGGGGHARVGAISLTVADLPRAKQIALGVAEELRQTERHRLAQGQTFF